MLVSAGDTVLGTQKISFTAIGGSCPYATSREAPGQQQRASFRAPTSPAIATEPSKLHIRPRFPMVSQR